MKHSGWYRGDCHVHSQRSHGAEMTPEQLASAAREIGLDFIAVTEHNTADTHAVWQQLATDDLLVILGQEIVTETGHWLALGIESGQVIDGSYALRDNRIDQAVAQVHHTGGLCVVAHPHAPYPSGTFAYPLNGFDAVEVWNGLWTSDLPWNADNEAALAEWGRGLAADVHGGRWRPAIGNSDVHLHGQIGTPQTVVRAQELTSGAVLAGIRAGHCWITESAAVRLSFTATTGDHVAGIGDRLETDGQPVVLHLEIRGVPSGTVTFHTERGCTHEQTLSSDGAGSIEWSTDARESMFARVQVRHSDGRMAAFTNPILLS
jgi:hypothetical protein